MAHSTERSVNTSSLLFHGILSTMQRIPIPYHAAFIKNQALASLEVLSSSQENPFHVYKAKKIAESPFYFYSYLDPVVSPQEIFCDSDDDDDDFGGKIISLPVDMDKFPLVWEDVPHMEYILPLYSSGKVARDHFCDGVNALLASGCDLRDNADSLSLSHMPQASKQLLDISYALVSAAKQVIDAPPGNKRLGISLPGDQKAKLLQLFKSLGTDKTESFREATRRYLPRWMHHPLSLPEDYIPEEDRNHAYSLWSGHASAEYLIHPDHLEQGNAPASMALKTAEVFESEGKTDLAYAIRTNVVIDLLTMERENDVEEKAYEIPFFTNIFSGVMVGDVGSPPKRAHYNYQQALTETCEQTVYRLKTELAEHTDGSAVDFLSKMGAFYSEERFAGMVASLLQREKGSDLFSLMRGLSEKQFSWSAQLVEQFKELPERRIITADEAKTVLCSVATEQSSEQKGICDLSEDIATLAADADVFQISDKIPTTDGSKAEVRVVLDTLGEEIDVVFVFKKDGKTRMVPFSFSFFGDLDSFTCELLQNESLDPQTKGEYRAVIAGLLFSKAEEKRRKKATQDRLREGGSSTRPASSGEVVFSPEQRGSGKKKKKRRSPESRQPETETIVFSSDTLTSDVSRGITLVGLTKRRVSELLDKQKIQAVTVADVIARMKKIRDTSASARRIFGKIVPNTISRGVNLREFRWGISGNAYLKIYFEDQGDGKFAFRGIVNSSGMRSDQRALDKIISTIIAERTAKK